MLLRRQERGGWLGGPAKTEAGERSQLANSTVDGAFNALLHRRKVQLAQLYLTSMGSHGPVGVSRPGRGLTAR
jgi:hypothetical protein